MLACRLEQGTTLLCSNFKLLSDQFRTLKRIPWWEYHQRFDQTVGKKIPAQDVLDRFKRLNNGVWIRAVAGRTTRRYQMSPRLAEETSRHVMCSAIECQVLDKLTNRFWVRPKYYIEDPYAPYHVRHGIKSPRVGYNHEFVRERPKILMEDTIADKHFYDR